MDIGCDDVSGVSEYAGDGSASTPELLPSFELSEVSDMSGLEGGVSSERAGVSSLSVLFKVLVFKYKGCGSVLGVSGVPGLPGVSGVSGFMNGIPDEFGVPRVFCLSGVTKILDVSGYVKCNGVPIMAGISEVLDLSG